MNFSQLFLGKNIPTCYRAELKPWIPSNKLNRNATNWPDRSVSVGEFRPGNLCPHNRKCDNPKCQCARPGGTLHHGWALTRKVRRKTRCRSIPEFALDDTRRQVDEYQHFLDLVSRFTEINEMLCDRRLKFRRNEKNAAAPPAGFADALAAETLSEINLLLGAA